MTKKVRRAGTLVGDADYQIFISHATADKWIARVICEKLEAAGASTFRDDRDINGGDDIPQELRRQIRRSKELLVLLTPKSVDRQWVMIEIGAAWVLRKNFPIVAVLYHVDFGAIPELLKSVKAYPLNDFDQYLADIERRVRTRKTYHDKTS